MAKDHSSVVACKSDTFAAEHPYKGYNFSIDIPDKNHPCNFHSFVICNAKSLEKLSLLAHTFHFFSYFRSAPMYDNGFDSHITQEYNIFYDVLHDLDLSLIHISEPTRLGMISYAVF